MNINYQSDFKIIERLMPDAPFRFTYYVAKDKGSVTAEYDGQSYSGCFVDGERLIVPVDGGTLGIGNVRVKREYFLDDKAFADGVCNLVSVEGTDIELGRGRTDSDIEADVEVGVYYKTFTFDDMTEEQKQEIADRVPTKEAEREKAEAQRVAAEDDREAAEIGRADAEAARVLAEEEREKNYRDKVDRDDYAPDLTAGFADNLVGRGEATSEVIGFRPSGGKSILDGTARIDRLKGNTVVWNQLIDEWRLDNGGLTISHDGAKATINGTTSAEYLWLCSSSAIAVGHKGLIRLHIIKGDDILEGAPFGLVNKTNVRNVVEDGYANVFYTLDDTFPDFLAYGIIIISKGVEFQDVVLTVNSFDLTQMFGAGNEPTTIEEFNARKPLGVSDASYNAGELISTTADEIKSVGFNAWDEEWEAGSLYIDIGSNDNETPNSIRSKGYTKVLPNTTYFAKTPQAVQSYFVVVEYDEEKKFIRHIRGGSANKSFVTSSTCRYIRFRYVGTNHYNNDICINLVHTGYRNGEYEPYEEFRRSLPISEIKDSEGNALFPNGLLSAGSVYDEITATKAIRRIGVVDLGKLNWERNATNTQGVGWDYFTAAAPTPKPNQPSAGGVANSISPLYECVASYALSDVRLRDKTYMIYHSSGIVFLRDDSYTDAATFKAAMQGVMLYYELAEPIEVDLPEPINMDYEVSDFGTEEVISDTPTTPLKADIIYQFNAVDRIRENSQSLEDLIKRVAALEAQNAALAQQLNANGETE